MAYLRLTLTSITCVILAIIYYTILCIYACTMLIICSCDRVSWKLTTVFRGGAENLVSTNLSSTSASSIPSVQTSALPVVCCPDMWRSGISIFVELWQWLHAPSPVFIMPAAIGILVARSYFHGCYDTCNFATWVVAGSLQYYTVTLPSFYCPPDAFTHLSPYLSIWTLRLVQTSSRYRLPGGENRYGPVFSQCPAVAPTHVGRSPSLLPARRGPYVLPVHYLSVIVARADYATASPSWCPIFTIRRANSEDGVYKTGCFGASG